MDVVLKKQKPGAIVIGGHFHGLGLVRALAKQGVPVILLDHENSAGKFSRYVTHFYRCPNAFQSQELLEFLTLLASQKGLEGWVIFPTDDETVYFLSQHKSQLETMYRIPTPAWEITKYAYNKKYTYRLAESIGLSIPKTYYPNSKANLDSLDIPFPAIIKPAVMRSFFLKTHRKVIPVENRDALLRAYKYALTLIPQKEILIQERIPEVSKNLYSFSPFFKNGEVLARVIVQRIRQHPMDFGHATTYAVTHEIPILEELGQKILSAMQFYGICEVEFIRDPRDGVYKFLEVNPRIWGWHTIAIRAGVNLPYLLYLDQIGIEKRVPDFRKGVKWMREITDIPTVFLEIMKGRMSIKEYFLSLKGEKELAVFSWDDPFPFLGELLRLPYLLKQRGF